MASRGCLGAVAALLLVSACGRVEHRPISVRLVDTFKADAIAPTVAARLPSAPRAEWRFDRDAGSRGWEAGPGLTSVAVRDGRLTGRTTGAIPILHVPWQSAGSDPDLLHAFEIRMRVSAGTQIAVSVESDEKVDLGQIERDTRAEPWIWTSPLIPGSEFNTYVLQPPFAITATSIRHVLVQPSDQPAATFEIEFIRLVFRKEHLAGIASGVSWQGLSGIYHEAIVTRSPQTWRATLDVPAGAWADLSIGTIEAGPVGFRVTGRPRGGGDEKVLLERTVTTPHRWENVPLDLQDFARQPVTLEFSLNAEGEGTLGFWGSPVIRTRGGRPVPVSDTSSRRDPPQGVIIIWADTLRRDHLDVYGHGRPTAPVVRRMAAEGVLFKNCVSQATWTKVSTPSLMTSLYPSSHGVKRIIDRVPASAMTIAEVFRDAGYTTFSFASNDFTGQMTNLHQGFDEVHESESVPKADLERNKTSRIGMDRLLPWIEAHRDVPFFAFLSFLDPHDPYKPYAPYDTLWSDPDREKEHERQTEQVRKVITQPFLRRFAMPSREELLKAGVEPERYVDFNRGWYDGAIRGLDAEIGRLFERLRTLGLDRKTLVVFTSDHGEEFLEHGRTFHGQSVYGELNQVPLVLRWPGRLPAGATVSEPVQTIDIMPTLLEVSGLRGPSAMQGRSLSPALEDTGPNPNALSALRNRPAVTEKWPDIGDQPPLDTTSFALVMDGWKLVHNATPRAGTQKYELYEFANDPLDQTDIAARHPDVVARLSKALEGWRAKVAAEQVPPDSEATKGLTQEQLNRLRSLGYIR